MWGASLARQSSMSTNRIIATTSNTIVIGAVVCLFVCLFNSYSVSAASPQLCPDTRRGRQPTQCGRESASPHFTLERAICPQRPGGVWLLSTTMYISSLEVTCLPVFMFLRLCSCVYAVLEASYVQRWFKARRGSVASCFASVIPSVSP
jgi:hypothetical protein